MGDKTEKVQRVGKLQSEHARLAWATGGVAASTAIFPRLASVAGREGHDVVAWLSYTAFTAVVVGLGVVCLRIAQRRADQRNRDRTS